MKRWMMIVLVVVMSVIVLLGCAFQATPKIPSPTTITTRTLQPAPGKALVYYLSEFYYPGSANAVLDGMTSPITRNTYVVWEVEPGEHQLEFKQSAGILTDDQSLKITCEAGQTYFFHLIVGDPSVDPDSRKLAAYKTATGRAKVAEFFCAGWFRDGALVPEETKQ